MLRGGSWNNNNNNSRSSNRNRNNGNNRNNNRGFRLAVHNTSSFSFPQGICKSLSSLARRCRFPAGMTNLRE
ncbi:MAG: hypothetical protein ACKV1O_22940 [Saprospiraceae bacterium]